jgi:hypothetical protein
MVDGPVKERALLLLWAVYLARLSDRPVEPRLILIAAGASFSGAERYEGDAIAFDASGFRELVGAQPPHCRGDLPFLMTCAD